jgi:hypothetical protein
MDIAAIRRKIRKSHPCVSLGGEENIMERVLVNTEEFSGRYVAMKDFDDNTIVGVGDDPEEALKDAESKGHKDAVILYVPERGIVHIYCLD